MRKKERFVCWVPCKPYVLQYLKTNFNAPDAEWTDIINLSQDSMLLDAFRTRLTRMSEHYDNRYNQMAKYSTVAPIEISRDDFYRYGWSLTPTEAVSFCKLVEHRVKNMLFTYVDVHRTLGVSIADSINRFADDFGFTESIWSYDSMRREYNRHGFKGGQNVTSLIFEQTKKIILVNLSRYGTISQQGKNNYETANF